MKTADFDYELPEELIAQTPVEPRDHSRLLVYHGRDGSVEHRRFYDIIEYLNPGDALVLNETRVIPARLLGEKDARLLTRAWCIQNTEARTDRTAQNDTADSEPLTHDGPPSPSSGILSSPRWGTGLLS